METETSNLFQSIREIISRAQQQLFRQANSALLESYWHIGRLIVQDEQAGKIRAQYGEQTLKNLATQLNKEFGKGFDYTNLTNMRRFFLAFPKFDAVRQELSWTHYRLLCRIDEPEKRHFYTGQSIANNWNTRTLQRQINSLSFERLLIPQKEKDNPDNIRNLIKDPYILEFLGLPAAAKHSEHNIETAILDHIQQFLLELGKGFAFVARQQHIVTDTSDFYIDLVFYNFYLKCFVLIDLKSGTLSHQDIGQIDMYVRMYDDLKRNPDDNPTIGILLCRDKDETIVKYSVLNDKKQLFASKYLLYLPKEEELRQLIENDRMRYKHE